MGLSFGSRAATLRHHTTRVPHDYLRHAEDGQEFFSTVGLAATPEHAVPINAKRNSNIQPDVVRYPTTACSFSTSAVFVFAFQSLICCRLIL